MTVFDAVRKKWPIVDTMPEGWAVDRSVGSPLPGHVVVTNRRSVLTGNKRALLCVIERQHALDISGRSEPEPLPIRKKKPPHIIDPQTPRRANELARAKFKQKMLADILVDMQICEIEGWGKLEYLNEIRSLINTIGSEVIIENSTT